MNIIEKIKVAASQNGMELNISGSAKSKIFYNKVIENPYKIISCKKGATNTFSDLCNKLIQTRNVEMNNYQNGYSATFTEDGYKLIIDYNINLHHTISIYKTH